MCQEELDQPSKTGSIVTLAGPSKTLVDEMSPGSLVKSQRQMNGVCGDVPQPASSFARRSVPPRPSNTSLSAASFTSCFSMVANMYIFIPQETTFTSRKNDDGDAAKRVLFVFWIFQRSSVADLERVLVKLPRSSAHDVT